MDEIGDLDFGCQVKLLRVLQDRTFEPVGSSKSRTVNVRVVSATNKNLMEMVQKGIFREDLLYRLNLIVVHLPPLRERRSDIALLAQHFLEQVMKVYRRSELRMSKEALQWIQARDFPGNIRELRHLIERAVIMTTHDVLTAEDFQASLGLEQGVSVTNHTIDTPLPEGMSLEEMEKAMIIRALEKHGDNLGAAAEILGISRYALYRRMEKYGLGTVK